MMAGNTPCARQMLGKVAKLVFLFFLIGISITVVAQTESVELRLWNIPPKTSTEPLHIAQRRVFEAFVRNHPEIRVRAIVPLNIQGPAAEGNEFLAVAGGVAPDVFFLYGRKVGDYRDQGFLAPLNTYLDEYRADSGRLFAGIEAPDSVWELCVDQGKVYALPIAYYSMALRLRRSSLERAGLTNQVPQNWDQLYEFARRMTWDPAKEPGSRPNDPIRYGISMQTDINAGWTFHQYVWAAGGEVLSPFLRTSKGLEQVPPPLVDYEKIGIQIANQQSHSERVARQRADLSSRGLPLDYGAADLEWRLMTDQPKALQALLFYRKLVHQPWIRNKGKEFDITPEMFASGVATDPFTGDQFRIADPGVQRRIYWGVTNAGTQAQGPSGVQRSINSMEIGVLNEASMDNPLEWVLAPFPSIDGSPAPAFIAGSYIGLNATIQSESAPGRGDANGIRQAAWRYMSFMTSPEAQRIMVNTLVEYGLAEHVRPAMLRQAGLADEILRIPENRRALWEGLEERAKPEPYSKGYSHVMTRELSMALGPVFTDKPDRLTGKFSRDPVPIMKAVVDNTNRVVLGEMPAEEVQRRSGIGIVIFGVALLALIIGARAVIMRMMQADKTGSDEGFGVGSDRGKRRVTAWIFLIPAVGTILLWNYLPLAKGLLMAFQDFRIVGESQWVGLRNFIEAVAEPKFWKYMFQTFVYVVLSIGLGFMAPILLAILLHEVPKGKVVFRVLYYLPAVTTGLVTLFLWRGLLYEPSNSGILNQIILGMNSLPGPLATLVKVGTVLALIGLAGYGVLAFLLKIGSQFAQRMSLGVGILSLIACVLLIRSLGEAGVGALIGPFNFQAQGFLNDPTLALLWVVLPTIWAGAGPGCLIFLAALKGIPSEQYEAADLDGAGVWEKLTNVTYPNLRALIAISFVGAVIGGFKESGNIFVMTGGGPEDATMTIGLHIWYSAFMFLNFGLATAMAWIMGALLIGFTLKQLQILNKVSFRNSAVEAETKGGQA